jgi:hypothetical protein
MPASLLSGPVAGLARGPPLLECRQGSARPVPLRFTLRSGFSTNSNQRALAHGARIA